MEYKKVGIKTDNYFMKKIIKKEHTNIGTKMDNYGMNIFI